MCFSAAGDEINHFREFLSLFCFSALLCCWWEYCSQPYEPLRDVTPSFESSPTPRLG